MRKKKPAPPDSLEDEAPKIFSSRLGIPILPKHHDWKAVERALESATKTVELLGARLPDPIAGFLLAKFLSYAIVPLLVEQLRAATETDLKAGAGLRSQATRYLAGSIHGAAVSLSKALLDYAHHHPHAKDHIARSDIWPVLTALDPVLNIQKVVRNPEGPAGKLYAPILEFLGKKALTDPQNTRSPGLFHELADRAAQDVCEWFAIECKLRGRGLPWVFDFPDGLEPHALPSTVRQNRTEDGQEVVVPNSPRIGNKREWAIAIKYYLYLTWSPEPQRTELRNYWRNIRQQKFNAFVPDSDPERRLHQRLCELEPLPPPADRSADIRRFVRFSRVNLEKAPLFLGDDYLKTLREQWNPDNWMEKPPAFYEPEWVMWWREYLQYRPEALFGNETSIMESKDASVVKLLSGQGGKRKPLAAFGKCVDAVLNAFLTTAGVTSGLKAIQSTANPLPRIRMREPDSKKP